MYSSIYFVPCHAEEFLPFSGTNIACTNHIERLNNALCYDVPFVDIMQITFTLRSSYVIILSADVVILSFWENVINESSPITCHASLV